MWQTVLKILSMILSLINVNSVLVPVQHAIQHQL